jgi:hypothetical protein
MVLVPEVTAGSVVTKIIVLESVSMLVIVVSIDDMGVNVTVTNNQFWEISVQIPVGVTVMVVWDRTTVKARTNPIE